MKLTKKFTNVLVLLDADMASCYLAWWQIALFDLVLLALWLVIYTQMCAIELQKKADRYRDGFWE